MDHLLLLNDSLQGETGSQYCIEGVAIYTPLQTLNNNTYPRAQIVNRDCNSSAGKMNSDSVNEGEPGLGGTQD